MVYVQKVSPLLSRDCFKCIQYWISLQWRHNARNGVSNHHCLLKHLFRRIPKKTSKLRFTGIHRWPVSSPHKRPVTRKMFPFDDVIINKMFHGHWCIVSVGQWYQWRVVDEMTTLLLLMAGPFIKYSRIHNSIQYCIFILTFFMPYMFLFL